MELPNQKLQQSRQRGVNSPRRLKDEPKRGGWTRLVQVAAEGQESNASVSMKVQGSVSSGGFQERFLLQSSAFSQKFIFHQLVFVVSQVHAATLRCSISPRHATVR